MGGEEREKKLKCWKGRREKKSASTAENIFRLQRGFNWKADRSAASNGGGPHIFAAYTVVGSMKATEVTEARLPLPPCGQLQWDEGGSAVLRGLLPFQVEEGMGIWRRRRFRRWKVAENLWPKYGVNVNKECRGDVRSRGPEAHQCHMLGNKKTLLKVIHLPGLVWLRANKQWEETRQPVKCKQHSERGNRQSIMSIKSF